MKNILFMIFITVMVPKNYCQALRKDEASRGSYNNRLHKTIIDNRYISDSCIDKPDSAMLISLKQRVEACNIYIREVWTACFPFNTVFTYPVTDIVYDREREWERAFKGVRIR